MKAFVRIAKRIVEVEGIACGRGGGCIEIRDPAPGVNTMYCGRGQKWSRDRKELEDGHQSSDAPTEPGQPG